MRGAERAWRTPCTWEPASARRSACVSACVSVQASASGRHRRRPVARHGRRHRRRHARRLVHRMRCQRDAQRRRGRSRPRRRLRRRPRRRLVCRVVRSYTPEGRAAGESRVDYLNHEKKTTQETRRRTKCSWEWRRHIAWERARVRRRRDTDADAVSDRVLLHGTPRTAIAAVNLCDA